MQLIYVPKEISWKPLNWLPNPCFTILLCFYLFPLPGKWGMVCAQAPTFAPMISDTFGMDFPPPFPRTAFSKLVDIDHDGVLEAFVSFFLYSSLCASMIPQIGEIHFYENDGDNAFPDFRYVPVLPGNDPFGLKQVPWLGAVCGCGWRWARGRFLLGI